MLKRHACPNCLHTFKLQQTTHHTVTATFFCFPPLEKNSSSRWNDAGTNLWAVELQLTLIQYIQLGTVLNSSVLPQLETINSSWQIE